MNQNSRDAEEEKAEHLRGGWKNVQLLCRISHDGQAGGSVHKTAEIDLSEGNQKSRVYRKQQHEIELPGADEFGKLRAIDQKKRLENLLNKMAGTNQHDDLPFRPVGDPVGVQINHADESELQRKPKQLNKNPEKKVGLETHFPDDRISPERAIDFCVMSEAHFKSTPHR